MALLVLCHNELTHCGIVTPYGDRDLGQQLFRWWLVAWRHQAITWINVEVSALRSSDVHLKAISLEISQPSVTKISVKIIFLRFYWNLPGANELTTCIGCVVRIHMSAIGVMCVTLNSLVPGRPGYHFKTASHYLSQCWPSSKPPYGVTRPQWVKSDPLLFAGKGYCLCLTQWSLWDVAAILN